VYLLSIYEGNRSITAQTEASLRNESSLDVLRDDRRFEELVRRVGLK